MVLISSLPEQLTTSTSSVALKMFLRHLPIQLPLKGHNENFLQHIKRQCIPTLLKELKILIRAFKLRYVPVAPDPCNLL